MPHHRIRVVADGDLLRTGFARVRTEFEVPADFPPDVEQEAAAVAVSPRLPGLDLTDVGFVTIDPPGAKDLDQALHISRLGTGYRVRYAIADVAAFVAPGDCLDIEAHARATTIYSPDLRTPLYPTALSEAAASLLPHRLRPALVWTIDLDADGAQTEVDVVRALVRSHARLDYGQAQHHIDAAGSDDADVLGLLAEVGRLRQAREIARGAVSLRLPEQEVDEAPGGFRLHYRAPRPVEDWNAQISLLTGMAAASLMLDAGIGVLRTLPPPDPGAVAMLRRSAHALRVTWPRDVSYPAFIRALDPADDVGAALLELATRLLRGASYLAFDGTHPVQAVHSAVAAPYAHATAPLRRLVDRYVGEVCRAVCAGDPVPESVRGALPAIPPAMEAGAHRAHCVERASVDLVETVVLASHLGETFEADVVEAGHTGGVVQLRRPPVRARCDGAGLPLGERIDVRLEVADPATRRLLFRRAGYSDAHGGRAGRAAASPQGAEESPGSTGQGGG